MPTLTETNSTKELENSTKNRSKQPQYARKWFLENRDKAAKSVKNWEKKNPEKLAAHKYIKTEIYNKGKKPGKCAVNNSACSSVVDAHHCDYSKPREVMWLCRKHHKAWHRLFTVEVA